MRKIFITENVETFSGDVAESFLNTKNDLEFFDEKEQGVHKVPKDRWELAQKYEKTTWVTNNPHSKDDRNYDHLEKFGSLELARDELVNKTSIIELGCGPFTNLRLFLDLFKFDQVALLDPLIHDYINLEHCPYNKSLLKETKVTLIKSSIEDFNLSNYSYELPNKFDVVVMINVIEHCFDVNIIFDKILHILNDGGIFIFSDVYFKDVHTLASNVYDAGHPLRLSELKMNEFLKNFKPIFDERYHGLYDQEWRNDIYFIGKKI